MGHTWGALSLQDTWQANEHTAKAQDTLSDLCPQSSSCLRRAWHPKKETVFRAVPTNAQGRLASSNFSTCSLALAGGLAPVLGGSGPRLVPLLTAGPRLATHDRPAPAQGESTTQRPKMLTVTNQQERDQTVVLISK